MSSSDPPPLEDFYLDILGQQCTKVYTQICFCYPLPETRSPKDIVDVLKKGLARLSVAFPYLAGQVVNEGFSEGNSGIYKIAPLKPTPDLAIKDLSDDDTALTYEKLRSERFPFRLLDESILCPRTTIIFPGVHAIDPVCLMQATFIKGGLLFTFLGHHAVMDGVGQGHIMRLLSKACRGEEFTPDELRAGNAPRRDILPLEERNIEDIKSELEHQIVKPRVDDIQLPKTQEPCSWAYFLFGADSLARLKVATTETLPANTDFISTDDALTALVWQSLTRIRHGRFAEDLNLILARQVDVRKLIGVSPQYPGLAQNMSYHKSSTRELLGQTLGEVAADLRKAVNPATTTMAHTTRALATLLTKTLDKTTINVAAEIDMSKDIMMSSWGKLNCYDLDFGFGLGTPQAVRRPQFLPIENLMYILPKSPEGEIALAICIRDDDMDRLSQDEEFMKYAEYVA